MSKVVMKGGEHGFSVLDWNIDSQLLSLLAGTRFIYGITAVEDPILEF